MEYLRVGWQKQGIVNSYTPVLHACVRARHAAVELWNEKRWGSPKRHVSKAELAFCPGKFPLDSSRSIFWGQVNAPVFSRAQPSTGKGRCVRLAVPGHCGEKTLEKHRRKSELHLSHGDSSRFDALWFFFLLPYPSFISSSLFLCCLDLIPSSLECHHLVFPPHLS